MKEIKCESGNKYGVIYSFGSMNASLASIISALPDETVGKIGERLQKKGLGMEAFQREVLILGGDILKDTLLASSEQSGRTIANMIGSLNGESLGDSIEERLKFVNGGDHPMGFLDPFDGLEIVEQLAPELKRYQEKKAAQQGESKPSSKNNSGAMKATIKALPQGH